MLAGGFAESGAGVMKGAERVSRFGITTGVGQSGQQNGVVLGFLAVEQTGILAFQRRFDPIAKAVEDKITTGHAAPCESGVRVFRIAYAYDDSVGKDENRRNAATSDSTSSDRTSSDRRMRLALLCHSLAAWPELEPLLATGGAEDALARIRAALRDGPTVAAAMTTLLDQVDEAGLRVGLDGATTGTRGFRSLPPGLPESTRVQAWVCPRRGCSRVVLPDETPDRPDCALAGVPMSAFAEPA
jgi:hypothetical protein